jgi:DnaJ-class molecular chaperone
MQSNKEKNYYNILHADRGSDEATLKKCFHKAALMYHPDKGGSDAEFQLVNEAWQVLSDNIKRQQYDNVSALIERVDQFK